MDKLIILCFLLFISLIGFVAGYYVMFDHSFENTYTSAVCSGNTCRDFEFTCLNEEIVNSRAISGFVVFGENWTDLRVDKNKC